MGRYLLVRSVYGLLALLAVSVLVFGLSHASGNPLDMFMPEDATQEDYARMAEKLGIDKPAPVQYGIFLKNAFKGDFGTSMRWRGRSSLSLFFQRLPATLQLAALSFAIAVGLGVTLGVASAIHKDRWPDVFGKTLAMAGQAIPTFWLGIMLIWLFAVILGLLPTSGRGGISHLIMPAVVLGTHQLAGMLRLTRSAMLDVLDTEFVKLARAKGLPESRVVWKHCFRNAIVSPLTFAAIALGSFLTGSVVVETVFAWPGVGQLAVEAVRFRDFPVVQTIVLLFAAMYIAINIGVDIIYAWVDPRIRYT